MTAPTLERLAQAALAVLARAAERTDGETETWRAHETGSDGVTLEISCTGPGLPSAVPRDIAPPSMIGAQRPWIGTHRLIVKAPLIVFDLYWRPDEPVRIMAFSRGDWENELLALSRKA